MDKFKKPGAANYLRPSTSGQNAEAKSYFSKKSEGTLSKRPHTYQADSNVFLTKYLLLSSANNRQSKKKCGENISGSNLWEKIRGEQSRCGDKVDPSYVEQSSASVISEAVEIKRKPETNFDNLNASWSGNSSSIFLDRDNSVEKGKVGFNKNKNGDENDLSRQESFVKHFLNSLPSSDANERIDMSIVPDPESDDDYNPSDELGSVPLREHSPINIENFPVIGFPIIKETDEDGPVSPSLLNYDSIGLSNFCLSRPSLFPIQKFNDKVKNIPLPDCKSDTGSSIVENSPPRTAKVKLTKQTSSNKRNSEHFVSEKALVTSIIHSVSSTLSAEPTGVEKVSVRLPENSRGRGAPTLFPKRASDSFVVKHSNIIGKSGRTEELDLLVAEEKIAPSKSEPKINPKSTNKSCDESSVTVVLSSTASGSSAFFSPSSQRPSQILNFTRIVNTDANNNTLIDKTKQSLNSSPAFIPASKSVRTYTRNTNKRMNHRWIMPNTDKSKETLNFPTVPRPIKKKALFHLGKSYKESFSSSASYLRDLKSNVLGEKQNNFIGAKKNVAAPCLHDIQELYESSGDDCIVLENKQNYVRTESKSSSEANVRRSERVKRKINYKESSDNDTFNGTSISICTLEKPQSDREANSVRVISAAQIPSKLNTAKTKKHRHTQQFQKEVIKNLILKNSDNLPEVDDTVLNPFRLKNDNVATEKNCLASDSRGCRSTIFNHSGKQLQVNPVRVEKPEDVFDFEECKVESTSGLTKARSNRPKTYCRETSKNVLPEKLVKSSGTHRIICDNDIVSMEELTVNKGNIPANFDTDELGFISSNGKPGTVVKLSDLLVNNRQQNSSDDQESLKRIGNQKTTSYPKRVRKDEAELMTASRNQNSDEKRSSSVQTLRIQAIVHHADSYEPPVSETDMEIDSEPVLTAHPSNCHNDDLKSVLMSFSSSVHVVQELALKLLQDINCFNSRCHQQQQMLDTIKEMLDKRQE